MEEKAKHSIDNAHMYEDFVFSGIMNNEQICKETLEEILKIKVKKIERLEPQKFVNTTVKTKKEKKDYEEFRARGIRFDIYLESDNSIYNLEMQNLDTHNLPQRARYYMGQINSLVLKPKDNFNKLNKAYVIFICTFDLFNQGENMYEFVYKEKKSNLLLNDGSEIIFLNTTSNNDNISENLKGFLKFIECSTIETVKEYDSPLAKKAYDQLLKLRKDKKVRKQYMKYSIEKEKYLEQGEAKGIQKEKRILAKNLLIEGDSIEKIAKVTSLTIEEIEEIRKEMKTPFK